MCLSFALKVLCGIGKERCSSGSGWPRGVGLKDKSDAAQPYTSRSCDFFEDGKHMLTHCGDSHLTIMRSAPKLTHHALMGEDAKHHRMRLDKD